MRVSLVGGLALTVVVMGGCGGTAPKPLVGVLAITAGGSHACALMADGTALCWGDNLLGELGALADAGVATDATTPVAVGLSGIVQIAAGGQHSCAVLSDATVTCWGLNSFGQLGNGMASLFAERETAIVGLANATSVVAMGPSVNGHELSDEYTCAVLAGGAVSCWGEDENGEIGDGTTQLFVATPSPLAGLTGVGTVGLGGERAYAVLNDGTVSSWGNDLLFQSTVPTAVPGLSDVASVTAGELHGCALQTDGTVGCWGNDGWGQLGDGSTTTPTTETPAIVPGLAGVSAISAGAHHTCALLDDGTIRCWGSNGFGQLGDGFKASVEPTPTMVSGIASAVAIAAGPEFTCALLADGSVKCWGANDSAQLGNGSASTNDVGTPVSVVAHP